MKCTHDKTHDKLSFATLRHLTGLLDEVLKQHGERSEEERASICGSFLFQAAYFLDNQWIEYNQQRYRVGLCFQKFAKDPFAPSEAFVTDYADGEVLHEAALGIAEAHFSKDDSIVPRFQQVGEAHEIERD